MHVSRDVICDLWALCAAGEASDDSRRLVDAFLDQDPELAERLRANPGALDATQPALPVDHEAEDSPADEASSRPAVATQAGRVGFYGPGNPALHGADQIHRFAGRGRGAVHRRRGHVGSFRLARSISAAKGSLRRSQICPVAVEHNSSPSRLTRRAHGQPGVRCRRSPRPHRHRRSLPFHARQAR